MTSSHPPPSIVIRPEPFVQECTITRKHLHAGGFECCIDSIPLYQLRLLCASLSHAFGVNLARMTGLFPGMMPITMLTLDESNPAYNLVRLCADSRNFNFDKEERTVIVKGVQIPSTLSKDFFQALLDIGYTVNMLIMKKYLYMFFNFFHLIFSEGTTAPFA
jgi:hypothetical protein